MECYNKIQYHNRSDRFPVQLLKFLIFVVAIRGFIDNFIGIGTLTVDITLIFIVLYSLLKKHTIKCRLEAMYLLLIIVFVFVLITQIMLEKCEIKEGVLGFRNDIAYTLPFLLCLRLLKTKEDGEEIYSFIMNCGMVLCCFAIVQYFGRSFLPDSLLVLKGEGHFSFWGTDVIRVNALVGNTVIFSGFTIMMTCYSWAQILNREAKKTTWVLFVSSLVANILTFSRASAVGVIVAVVVEYVIILSGKSNYRRFINRIILFIVVAIIAIALIVVFWDKITDSIIFKRLINSNKLWNEGSDATHYSSIKRAIELIKEHPIMGYGLGSVGYSASSISIITDGTIWIYFLSWGIPICLMYWGVFCCIILKAVQFIKKKVKLLSSVCIGFFVSNGYLIAAALINSSYSARIMLVFNWMIAGIILFWTSNETCLQETKE